MLNSHRKKPHALDRGYEKFTRDSEERGQEKEGG